MADETFYNISQKFVDNNWATANQSYFQTGDMYPKVSGTSIRRCPAKLDVSAEWGTTISFPLDPSKYTGDIETDIHNEYLDNFQTGVLVALDDRGFVTLADGADAKLSMVKAFVVVPATNNQLFENIPSLASGLLTVHVGGGMIRGFLQVVETDLVPGDVLYHGTGANKGLLTKTKGTNPVAIVTEGNTAQDPSVNILIL